MHVFHKRVENLRRERENAREIQSPCWGEADCKAVDKIGCLHHFRALTCFPAGLRLLSSTVERVGFHSSCQSEVGRVIQSGGATRRRPRPEKTDRPCEGRSGSGTAKAVITSRGCDGACLRVAGSLAGVGCWSITNVAALFIFSRLIRSPAFSPEGFSFPVPRFSRSAGEDARATAGETPGLRQKPSRAGRPLPQNHFRK